jgi:hypothetical protein
MKRNRINLVCLKKIAAKLFFLVLCALSIFGWLVIFSGCHDDFRGDKVSYVREKSDNEIIRDFFAGERSLRKMKSSDGIKSKTSTSFFLFCGSTTSSNESQSMVYFSWKVNDSIYQISSIPMTKVRMNFNEKATEPTVRFLCNDFEPFGSSVNDLPNKVQWYIDHCVDGLEIKVRESDWAMDVQLPMENNSITQ